MGDFYVLSCVLAAYAIALMAGARQRTLLPWFLAAVTIRVAMLALDAADIWAPPNSNTDAAGFIRQAHVLSAQPWPQLIAALDYRSAISYVVSGAALFKVIGFHPYAMQATNLVVGTINICLATLLVRKHISQAAATGAAVLLCLYPFSAFNSVVALREEFAILFFVAGLVSLMKWVDRRSIAPFFLANGFFVLASFVHPGFIGAVIAAAGYFMVTAVKDLGRGGDRRSSMISALVGFVMFLGAVVVLASGVQLGKGIELSLDPDALAGTIEGKFERESMGGSAYPAFVAQGNPISSPWLIFARMAYLLYSPFPWDVRSAVHIGGLLVGFLYLWLSMRAWRAWRTGLIGGRMRVLGWIFLALTLVFAIGTTNSGTAVRHKTKFFPLLVILAAPTFRRRIVFGSGSSPQVISTQSVRRRIGP